MCPESVLAFHFSDVCENHCTVQTHLEFNLSAVKEREKLSVQQRNTGRAEKKEMQAEQQKHKELRVL